MSMYRQQQCLKPAWCQAWLSSHTHKRKTCDVFCSQDGAAGQTGHSHLKKLPSSLLVRIQQPMNPTAALQDMGLRLGWPSASNTGALTALQTVLHAPSVLAMSLQAGTCLKPDTNKPRTSSRKRIITCSKASKTRPPKCPSTQGAVARRIRRARGLKGLRLGALSYEVGFSLWFGERSYAFLGGCFDCMCDGCHDSIQ